MKKITTLSEYILFEILLLPIKFKAHRKKAVRGIEQTEHQKKKKINVPKR